MDPRIVKKGNDYHFEPEGGDNFPDCVTVAVSEAKALGAPVTLHFNEIVMKLTGDEDAQALLAQRKAEQKRKRDAYLRSPAYKAAEAHRKAGIALQQQKIDGLVNSQLDTAIARGIGGVVGWLKDYADAADHIGVDGHHGAVLKKLLDAGYKPDAHVGRKDLMGNYAAAGEYIIGQAISSLELGSGPHPITGKFADELAEIKKVRTFPVMHTIKLNGKAPPPDTISLVPQLRLKPKTGG